MLVGNAGIFRQKLPGFWQQKNIIFQYNTIVVLAAGDLPNHQKMTDGAAYLRGRQQSTIVDAALWCAHVAGIHVFFAEFQ